MARRPLLASEIAEAQTVFGAGLDYTRAGVVERVPWPDWIDRVGAVIIGRQSGVVEHNAVTLGSTSYFPVTLRTGAEAVAAMDLRDMCWLIHELTHQWQYQHLGWAYLPQALGVQLRQGRRAYDYQREFASREDALKVAHKHGQGMVQFNLEQQGDIARDYYNALKRDQDGSAWEPFIEELRKQAGRLA